MKLTKTFQKLKTWFLTNLLKSEFIETQFVSFALLIFIIGIIYLGAPYFFWGKYALFQSEKRIYLLSFLMLLWLAKLIIWDTRNTSHSISLHQQKKWKPLYQRFHGALQFLKKTLIQKDHCTMTLADLPWYLLIGPSNAGKTTLLAHANAHFILQRQFHNQDSQHLEPSENCDWWATRHLNIVDVPGKYLAIGDSNSVSTKTDYFAYWKYFLHLIKKNRGPEGVNGIIIALPLSELIKENDSQKYYAWQQSIFRSLYFFQKLFSKPIPCHIVITKCDLVPGFSEFFAELANDEATQRWGITLPPQKNSHQTQEIFISRFNALIKKINQQLLYRLHHERDPRARVLIKDFPLHMEQMKEQLLDFVKKFSTDHFILSLQSINLVSAFQLPPEHANTILDEETNTTQKQVQIFKQPFPLSRTYFIKQFISQSLIPSTQNITVTPTYIWKKRITYTTAISIVVLVAIILGIDFERGLKQTYVMQNILAEFQNTLQQSHNTLFQLEKTLVLLDTLQQTMKPSTFKFDLSHLLSFYSSKTQTKLDAIYLKALQTILIPELKTYLEEYLSLPVNKNVDQVYAALKSYLMLNHPAHFQPTYIVATMQQILPFSFTGIEQEHLIQHINFALNNAWKPLALKEATVNNTRKYLLNISSIQLAYVILKNMDSNNHFSEINLIDNKSDPSIFAFKPLVNQVPTMFTGQSFADIFSNEVTSAANEAISGNWVLSTKIDSKNTVLGGRLADQLRVAYINNYVSIWENVLTNIRLITPNNLHETDQLILNMISNHSPLIQVLQILRENTAFEPITTSSRKLQSFSTLLEKNNEMTTSLYQIFAGLEALHTYIQPVLTAPDIKKAAFDLINTRIKNLGANDPLNRLRNVASKSPDPLRHWLNEIANNTWYFLMQEAARYIDTSWQNQIIPLYQSHIANRYPFNSIATEEVSLKEFINFFGYPGIFSNFYQQNLAAFIDTSTPTWQWKIIDNHKLPFSNDVLRQIQQAFLIQQIFFPNGDNKPYIRFAIQPYKFGKQIQSIKLHINNKDIVDTTATLTNSHDFYWPAEDQSPTSIQLMLLNQPPVNRDYPGDWGWFKLVNQSFESVITRKEMLLNFSMNNQPAKYILLIRNKLNPFLAINLDHFHLLPQLADQKTGE